MCLAYNSSAAHVERSTQVGWGKCQAEHGGQKMLYNRKVHEKMYQVGDMVLLHSCVISLVSVDNCTIHGQARFG